MRCAACCARAPHTPCPRRSGVDGLRQWDRQFGDDARHLAVRPAVVGEFVERFLDDIVNYFRNAGTGE